MVIFHVFAEKLCKCFVGIEKCIIFAVFKSFLSIHSC